MRLSRNRIEWNRRLDATLIVLRRRRYGWEDIARRMGFSADALRDRMRRLAFDDPSLAPLLKAMRRSRPPAPGGSRGPDRGHEPAQAGP
jgi:hypothetical protein